MSDPTFPLADRVAPRATALVLIDIQNDYLHPDGVCLCAPETAEEGAEANARVDAMTARLSTLVDSARNAGVLVVWAKMVRSPLTISEVDREQRLRVRPYSMDICLEGSWGAEFFRLAPAPGEPIVVKHRYSAFIGTDLEIMLRTRGIRTVVLAGVSTELCVESTARDAHQRDFHVVLADDCTLAASEPVHYMSVLTIGSYFGFVTPSNDIVAVWSGVQHR